MDKVLHQLQSVRYALKCSELNLCQKFITGKCFRSACLPLQCSHCMPVHIGWCLVNTNFTSHHWIGKSIVSCMSYFIWICTNGEAVIIAALHFYMYVFVLFVYVFGLYLFFFSPVFAVCTHIYLGMCIVVSQRKCGVYVSGILYVLFIVYCLLCIVYCIM